MRNLLYCAILAGFLAGCAKKDPVTTCNMQYNCNGNVSCANSGYGYSTHAGSFSNSDQNTAEAECVAWEYAFINGYGSTNWPYPNHPSVTACSCSTN